MTTDSPELVPLTLVDLTEQDLVEIALADAGLKLPGWQPREGNTEVVLLEAQALMVAELIYVLNLLPDAILDRVIAAYGLTLDAGGPPSASFTFASSAATPTVVPAGTRIRAVYNGGASALDFLTDVEGTIPPGGTVAVTATADENTEALNGTPTGVVVELVDAILAVDTVALTGPVTGGRNPETSDSFRVRGANLFRRLTSTLVLPEHYTAAALEVAGVARATTLDLYNPAAGSGAPGDHLGHVTVAVADAAGAPLSGPAAADLTVDLTAKSHAGVDVHVIAPTITAVPVTAALVIKAGHVEADVLAAARAALEEYLNPGGWPWAAKVYRNELIALLDRVDGVERVATITAPAGDVTLAGVAPLADAGTLTITATA